MRRNTFLTAALVAGVSLTAQAEDPETSPDATRADETEPAETPKPSGREKLRQLRRDYQPYAFNLYPYQPMYFAAGTDLAKSKFQFSFRYQFFGENGELAAIYPWLSGFNLAYTQSSFWDLQSESKPFEDTSYKPEFFFLSPFILMGPSWAPGFQVQGGFRHESNGQSGTQSRGTNFVYSKLHWIFQLTDTFALLLAPEVYVYVWNENETNPDLDKYRGHFDLEVMVAQKNGFSLATNYQHGTKGWSHRTEFTLPLHDLFNSNLEIYFFAQRFDGYAESLLDYRDKTHVTRLGISLIR